MPVKSEAQRRLMQAASNSPEVRKRTGITKDVADKFTQGHEKNLPAHKARAGAIRDRKRLKY